MPPLAATIDRPAEAPVRAASYPTWFAALHWIVAIVIATAWLLGNEIEDTPRGAERVEAIGLHALAGLSVLALVLPRLLSRLWAVPADPPGLSTLERRGSQASHWALYGLMIGLPLTGLTALLGFRGPMSIGGLVEVGPVEALQGLREVVEAIHSTGANALLLLVGLHALAGLRHVLLGDALAARLWPFGSRAR